MLSGTAPVPVSSGRTDRHRLNRLGDRQLNRAIHIIAVNRMRCHPPTQAYVQRRRAEGKTDREGPEHIDIHADGLAGEVDRLGPEHSGLWLDLGISRGQAEELLQQRIHQADWFVAEY
jgi:hypothetical protein